MIRSFTVMASISGAAGLSCAAGLALAFTNDLSNPAPSAPDPVVLAVPVVTTDALVEPLPGFAPALDSGEPSSLAVGKSPRPVARLAQSQVDDQLPAPPNHVADPQPVIPVLSFHKGRVTAPVRAVPVEEWVQRRGVAGQSQMPKINNVWKSGVYR